MKYPYTGVILSGGLSRRFDGENKAFLRIGEQRILDRIYTIFSELFDEIILVTNDPPSFLEWDLKIVTDLFDTRCSLTGIHAGLFYMQNPYGFFTACDTPFLKREMVEIVLEKIRPEIDIVIPEMSLGLEPLCAAYSKRCLERAERGLVRNNLKIQRVFRKNRMRKIPEKALRQVDPDLDSFFNVNTPQDLVTANEMMADTKP